MQSSKRVLVILVSAVVVLTIAAFVWAPEWFVASERSEATASERRANTDASALAGSAPVEEIAEVESRRALAAERSAPTDAVAAMPLSPFGPVVVHVAVDGELRLDADWRGTLLWSGGTAPAETIAIEYGSFVLPSTPHGVEQFSELVFAGLAARPLELVAIAPDDANFDDHDRPAFVLRAEFLRGATLVWSSSVPASDVCPVDIAYGGSVPPKNTGRPRIVSTRRETQTLRGFELPHALVRVASAQVIWVGGPARQWRMFPVTPESVWIEIDLEKSPLLRVLHDAPVGSRVVVFANAQHYSARVPIASDEVVEIDEAPAGEVRVFIESAAQQPLTRIESAVLTAGEITEVDLRTSTALDGRGGVRVVLRASTETLALGSPRDIERGQSGPSAIIEGTTNSETAPTSHGTIPKVASDGGSLTFEMLGLRPGNYFVHVQPFAASAEFDVVAGEITAVEIDAGCLGFIEFEKPTNLHGGYLALGLECIGATNHSYPYIDVDPSEVSTSPLPIVCGTYRAHVHDFGNGRFVSDPFAVNAGATTKVVLHEQPAQRELMFTLAAVDTATDAPLPFEPPFWTGIRILDVATGEPVDRGTRFVGSLGPLASVGKTVLDLDGLVRIEVPDDPFWTFEPIEAVELADGATITLRATAK